ncbi:hypothetical protein CLV28_0706 [Sediminihabitans luteus]|uniref:Uncharacterized protein n=1 Tax=Sediminihabitans luteus TaxID=1138585 RepID=A0A2M9D014_9CELL|nr:hypothetical protein [Sediminihabitans luteus]PJJ77487.1 hypothetical protein CLV28_0706 [Sediminihabitans luteus]GII98383.1 hypothetical protein Slu03_07610 [Sediminihabitans luteus]
MGMLMRRHYEKAGPDAPVADGPAVPDGDPTETWKADQLKAYAAEHDVDLAGATKKADVLAAILAATTPPTNPDGEGTTPAADETPTDDAPTS